MFQFHIGAIKSVSGFSTGASAVVFQFHIGAIKSPALDFGNRDRTSFNSILVRLKGQMEKVVILMEAGFNSILVRLKAPSQPAG